MAAPHFGTIVSNRQEGGATVPCRKKIANLAMNCGELWQIAMLAAKCGELQQIGDYLPCRKRVIT
jgi:hypothetical protein